MTETGIKIKETRTKRGLSQEDLAELSKVNLRTIQRIENNEGMPREKTLKLIYDALDIVVIENQKLKINTYLVWSVFLTLLVITGSVVTWLRFTIGYLNGHKVYRITNGWEGETSLNDYQLGNWLLSISAITVGLIAVAHSLELIKNKLKYVIVQIVILLLYVIGVFQWSYIQAFELRPGLFILVVATILLVVTYRKKDIKSDAIANKP